MISEEHKLAIDKIIASKSFGNSTTYANLLRYLFRCTLDNDVPKETTIAMEIFGKDNFDPSQSTLVRVYAYNLRKKLDKFYQNEGASEKYRIRIPKGSYALEVTEKKGRKSQQIPFFGKSHVIVLVSVLFISLLANLFMGSRERIEPIVNSNGLWKDLYASDLPTMLIMGDLFIYAEQDTLMRLNRTIRDPNINSLQQFEAFKANFAKTEIHIEPLTYSHLILGSTQWVKKLSEVFFSISKDYTVHTVSRFNPKQLQDYNMLVVGMQKTLGVFKSFHKNSDFEYDMKNDAFIHKRKDSDEVTVYKPEGDPDSYHTDYSLMAKVAGPNNNSIYIFSGLWDTGATQSLKNFTDATLLHGLEAQMVSKFGGLPKYYEVFFEVKGIDRMELSSKVLYMSEL